MVIHSLENFGVQDNNKGIRYISHLDQPKEKAFATEKFIGFFSLTTWYNFTTVES